MNNLNIDYYKEIYNIFLLFKNDDHQNIILCGDNYLKLDIIKRVFVLKFGENNTTNYIDDNIKYYYNDYYYYFDVNNIKNVKYFKNLLNTITKSYNYFTNNFKYIIFDNVNKSFIEKYNIKNLIEKRYMNIKLIFLSKEWILEDFCLNINCRTAKNEFGSDIMTKITNKMLFIFNNDFSLNSVKELCFNIMLLDVDLSELNKHLITYFLKKDIESKKKQDIIKCMCNNNYLMINSYKKIINLEALILNIYYILNDKLL